MARFMSPEIWDENFRRQTIIDWQWAFFEEVPAIPSTWSIALTAVNNRVQNFSLVRREGRYKVGLGAIHLIELTADQPYR